MTLQEEGERIVANLRLEETLNLFGEAHLVGNIALSTTVKPDIDFVIYCEPTEWKNIVSDLKTAFLATDHHNYEERELKQSGKYLITFEHQEEDTLWSIDITLTKKGGNYLTDSYRFCLDYKDKFTPKIIKTILPIKKYFYKKNMLRNSMSYYIYRAVIDEGATSVTNVYDYLQKNQIYLGKFTK